MREGRQRANLRRNQKVLYIRMQVAVHGTESLNLDQVILLSALFSMVRFKVNINLIAHPINQFIYSFIQNRWLLVEFIPCSDGQSTKRPANEINGKQIWSALKQSVLNNFGDTGWGAVGSSLTGTPSPPLLFVRLDADLYHIKHS